MEANFAFLGGRDLEGDDEGDAVAIGDENNANSFFFKCRFFPASSLSFRFLVGDSMSEGWPEGDGAGIMPFAIRTSLERYMNLNSTNAGPF